MNSLLKKLSVLMVMFVFLGLFDVVVSAKDDTQNTSANGNVILSQDEYNNLLERVEELEQLKANEINNNLFDYYEKSKVDRETSISEMFDGVAFVGTIAGVMVAISGVLMLFNFVNGTLASKKAKETNEKAEETNEKAEETNKKANDVIEEVNEQLVISKVNIEEMDKKLIQYDENVNNIENKLLILTDQTENKLNLYIKRVAALTAKDLFSCIEIYNEIIEEMKNLKVEDKYIFYDRGNAYLLRFKQELELKENSDNNLNIEIKNLEKIYSTEKHTKYYHYFLENALLDFNKFLEKNFIDKISTIAKIKNIECLIYTGYYEDAFILLNDINYELIIRENLDLKLISLIIVFPNLYEIFIKHVTGNNEFINDVSAQIEMYSHLIFKRIFANQFIFNESLKDQKIISEKKYKNDTYNILIQKLDSSYDIFNKLYSVLRYSSRQDVLLDVVQDFEVCTKIKNGQPKSKDVEFSVFNGYCKEFLLDLDDDKYYAILDKLTKMRSDLQNIETT